MFSAVSAFPNKPKIHSHANAVYLNRESVFHILPSIATPTLFVSGQHPDFDVSLGQLLDGLRDSVLQLVLHRCRPQQLRPTEGRVAM